MSLLEKNHYHNNRSGCGQVKIHLKYFSFADVFFHTNYWFICAPFYIYLTYLLNLVFYSGPLAVSSLNTRLIAYFKNNKFQCAALKLLANCLRREQHFPKMRNNLWNTWQLAFGWHSPSLQLPENNSLLFYNREPQ